VLGFHCSGKLSCLFLPFFHNLKAKFTTEICKHSDEKRFFFWSLHHQTHFDALICKVYFKNNELFHFLIFCSGNKYKQSVSRSNENPDAFQQSTIIANHTRLILSSFIKPGTSKQMCCFGWRILFANIVFWWQTHGRSRFYLKARFSINVIIPLATISVLLAFLWSIVCQFGSCSIANKSVINSH